MIDDLDPPSFQFGRGRGEVDPEEPFADVPVEPAGRRARDPGASNRARGEALRPRQAAPDPADVGDDSAGRRRDPLDRLRGRNRRDRGRAVHGSDGRPRRPRAPRVLHDGPAGTANPAARLRSRRGDGDRRPLRRRVPDRLGLRADLPGHLRLRGRAAGPRGDHGFDCFHRARRGLDGSRVHSCGPAARPSAPRRRAPDRRSGRDVPRRHVRLCGGKALRVPQDHPEDLAQQDPRGSRRRGARGDPRLLVRRPLPGLADRGRRAPDGPLHRA